MDHLPHHLKILNQLFDLEKKLADAENGSRMQRHVDRIKDSFEEMGLVVLNPLGEPYSETRTDVDADIAGDQTDKLEIAEVIKPIIVKKEESGNYIVQKGVVVAAQRKKSGKWF